MHGALVDRVEYDEVRRMTAMQFPAAGNLWRTQGYYPWIAKKNGGMLASLNVDLSEGTTSNSFIYDGLGRLTSAYGRTYNYDATNRMASFNGKT